MKIKWNGNFQDKVFGNLGIRPREVKLYKFRAFFYSAPSSFGLNSRDISHQDDGSAYSKMDQYLKFRILPLVLSLVKKAFHSNKKITMGLLRNVKRFYRMESHCTAHCRCNVLSSLLFKSIKSHHVDLSVLCLLLYL